MAVYGNVNVKYAPCKSVAQLHSAADYILGKKKEQLSSSVIKTKSELYNAFGCNRDNFANSVLKPDVSVYEAYDEFQEKHEIPENDESFFYGAAFDDFNKEWQGLDAGAGSVSTEFGTTNNSTDAEPYNEDELDELLDNNSSTVPVQNKPFPSPAEYRKLSLEKRAKLLPPPSDDRIEELKKYQDRMGYTEESMRSMRYKMSVYDDFTEEYDYRVKYNRNHSSEEQLKAQAEQQIITPVRRRGRGR